MVAIQYQISSLRPQAHLWDVRLKINKPNPEGQILRLPNWIPGSYMIRDFARHIIEIKASDEKGPIQLVKLDKSSWQAAPCSSELTLSYRVYSFDLSVRGAFLDLQHGFFNPTSLCLEVMGQSDQACELEILKPEHRQSKNWTCATAASPKQVQSDGFGTYVFSQYQDLLDHPFQLGELVSLEFMAAEVPHRMVFNQGTLLDKARLQQDMQKICEQHIDLFGRPAPMQSYCFMTHVSSQGYGGLEHRNSTALMCSDKDLPLATMGEQASEAYQRFLGLCSHEYFHSWNVKRMAPAVLLQANLQDEVHTPLLWFFEGVTSYYDDLALVRSGCIEINSYLKTLGQTITRVWRGRGRLRQSVAESSFDAWTRFYKQDENAANAIVSYYTKGSIVALCLDLEIRRRTQNRLSLDDLMRALWQRYLGDQPGHEPDTWLVTLQSLLPGEDCSEMKLWVESCEDPPLESLLQQAGVLLHWRCRNGFSDAGGQAQERLPEVDLGAILVKESGNLVVKVVNELGSAVEAGLAVGDQIVALDGRQLDMPEVEEKLLHAKIGERWQLHWFRDRKLMQGEIELQAAEATTCWLECPNSADLLPGWLQARA